jgi:IS605 OrfB family transposase
MYYVLHMSMDRTIKLRLELNNCVKANLKETTETYNVACNLAAQWGFENHTSSKIAIHNGTYYNIREQYPELPSSLVQAARDVASEALKGVKLKTLPDIRKHSAARFNQRTLRVVLDRGYGTLSTVAGRKEFKFTVPEYYQRYIGEDWTVRSSTVKYLPKKDEFWLHLVMRAKSPEPSGDEMLGIDRGIVNIAVCSDNSFFNDKQVKATRAKYAMLRQKLQSKGTKSAKKLLRKLSGKERRFVTDVNHCISKEVVAKPYDVFALEDLTSIRVQSRKGKNFQRKLNNWSFYQLEQFIRYKAEAVGKQVILVDPRFSSQKCSRCGNILKENRNGSSYHCRSCGFDCHADLNAARNIAQAGISCLSRLSVNQPDVSSS